MYERRTDPLLPRPLFLRRLGLHLLAAVGLLAVSLVIGALGYHLFGKLGWLDALLNAAMLLGGMGQVGEVATPGGKLFAAAFALYAGLLLIAVMTVVLTPVVHRILHSVHLEEEADVTGSNER